MKLIATSCFWHSDKGLLMRAVLLCCVLALSSVCVAASNSPAKKPVPHASESKEAAKDEQRGTERLPMFVNIKSIPQPTEEEKAEHAAERHEKAESDKWLVNLTGGLVIATVALFIATLFLWLATKRLANDAGKSAAETVNALQATERAYLFVEFSLNEALRSSPSGFPNTINVNIWNYGKTPAEVVKIRGYPLVQETQNIVPQSLIEFEGSDRELPPGLGIATNCAYPVPIDHKLTDNDLGEIERWNKKLFIVGCISYRDIFDEARETGFCWEILYHMGNQRFVPTRESPLNKRS